MRGEARKTASGSQKNKPTINGDKIRNGVGTNDIIPLSPDHNVVVKGTNIELEIVVVPSLISNCTQGKSILKKSGTAGASRRLKFG